MFSEAELKKFQEQLTRRKEELLAARQGTREETAPKSLDQTRVGRLSRMDAMQQQAMSQAADRMSGIELQRIKTALERIESGEYGYCILCEEEIAIKRLEFDPSLLSCIDCARKEEG